jgi:hypothetical protein
VQFPVAEFACTMPMGNGSDLWGGRGRAEKESRGGRMEGFEALVDAAFAAAGVGRGWMAELEKYAVWLSMGCGGRHEL